MARSKGVIISVKIPINWESMTERKKQRLSQITGRDTRVIRSFLGVIEQHEKMLLKCKGKDKIDDGKLDKLALTAIQVTKGNKMRLRVPHDLKAKYPRISTNELGECRLTAVALYESYLKLRKKKGFSASRPTKVSKKHRIPRWIFSRRFKLEEKKTTITRWWLNLIDSLDSVPEGKKTHGRLMIPLKISPFHLNQISRGEVKALQIFVDRSSRWWVSLAVRIDLPEPTNDSLPVAILGIDLGIEKAACTTLLTPEKTRESRYFVQRDKLEQIRKYNRLVSDLQRERHSLLYSDKNIDAVTKKLGQLRTKRQNVSKEYDRVLVRQLLDYIIELSDKYTIYVAIGRLKNIRMRAKKGSFQSRKFRGLIHSWTFSRITDSLKFGLSQLGWNVTGQGARFRAVPEAWTSIICWKCGSKGKRPEQNYFYCPQCGHKTNADRNGSINIAARLLTLTKSLHNVRGLGLWTRALDRARRARLKTRKKKPSSKGTSLLSKKGIASSPGESAAIHHAQSSLLSLSDGAELGDDDLAVGRTVEKLSVVGCDVPTSEQEKDAKSIGGIVSR